MSRCGVAGRCGGCSWIAREVPEQLAAKRADLAERFAAAGLDLPGPVELHALGDDGLRDRTDLGWDGRILGLHGTDGLVDVGPCPAVTEPLRRLLARIQADPLPIARASLRLRVSPSGMEGAWIDAANVDVKALLDEASWLRRRLAEGVVVELGQRRKPVVDAGDRLRLDRDPLLLPWWQTWPTDTSPVPIWGVVGGFTQPGHALNRLLVRRVMETCRAAGASRWVELGSGSGNLGIPLARLGRVRAVESDPIAVAGLERSIAEAGIDGITVHRADMTRDLPDVLDGAEAVLADPPRSGLGAAVEAIAASSAGALVMASCWAPTLVTDVRGLVDRGWRLVEVTGVDQFPWTPQAEWIVRLER